MTSYAAQHFAAPSYSSGGKKDDTTVSESVVDDLQREKLSVGAATEPPRRSQELSRPKRKPKPRPLDRFLHRCGEQSLVVKGFIIALVTSIPFVIFIIIAYALPSNTRVGPGGITTVVKLANWLIACWGSFVGILYVGRIISVGVNWICSLSTGLNRFRSLARETCLRVTLLLWAGVAYAIIPSIFTPHHRHDAKIMADAQTWIDRLQRVFMFLMIAFAIILVQGIFLMLIKIQYIEGYIGPRAERAANQLGVLRDLNSLVNPHIASDDIGIVTRTLKKLFMPINSRDPYYLITRGEGDEETWNEYAGNIWHTIANGKDSFNAQDLSRQLIAMNRDPGKGQELFVQLDESTDGQVTEDEVTKLVCSIGLQLNRHIQAMNGIRRLMAKLETVLTVLMLGLIVFVYVQFFEKDLAKNIGNLWTGIVGLAFAFSGAVSEFVNSTVFVFGKHAYDVGDYVEVKGKKYIVSRIFLTHTNFEQVQNENVRGLVTQMSHASLVTEPIVNWTRTVEEAADRHAQSDADSSKKSGAREENVAKLVERKLEVLGDKALKQD